MDAYIANARPFARPILKELRRRMHAAHPEISEEIKWRAPAFMYKGILANMAAFTQHAAFGFWDQMSGVSDKAHEAAGQFGRLQSVDDLPSERRFATLVGQAIARRDAGIRPKREKTTPKGPLEVPEDLIAALRKNRKALATFEALRPSHQREYVQWITEAKQEATRQRRLATTIDWLSEGKSMNWRYEKQPSATSRRPTPNAG
ncbi:MAG TPA: YdeI/OmpD-associated family protein [Vicinamibacterales bacterium]|nr:YdeI/OmpD-associated family protein [Vicinamibacterales bacterium]